MCSGCGTKMLFSGRRLGKMFGSPVAMVCWRESHDGNDFDDTMSDIHLYNNVPVQSSSYLDDMDVSGPHRIEVDQTSATAVVMLCVVFLPKAVTPKGN